MHRIVLLSCFLMAALLTAKAQEAEKDTMQILSSYHHDIYHLAHLPKKPMPSPFRQFVVLDNRPDTLRIGAHTGAGFFKRGNRQLVFARAAAEEVAGFLNDNFSSPAEPFTALVVLRVLWVSDETYTLAALSNDTTGYFNEKVRIKAEVYAENQGVYTPLVRFDSTLQMNRGPSGYALDENIAELLSEVVGHAQNALDKKGMNGRHLTLEDIRQFNQSHFDAAIYHDNARIKGVYRDFQEFKDNAPSIQSFEIRRDKGNLLLYTKEGSNFIYNRDAWGFCDGKEIYVMKDGELVPVWMDGKAFYLLGKREEGNFKRNISDFASEVPEAAAVTGMGFQQINTSPTTDVSMDYSQPRNQQAPKGHKASLRHIFVIDMDSGNLY